jgi:hypothetical protein
VPAASGLAYTTWLVSSYEAEREAYRKEREDFLAEREKASRH